VPRARTLSQVVADLCGAPLQHNVCEQEKQMNKDQIKGRAEEVKGKVKEVAGNVVGNKRVEAEGDAEQVAGKVQKTFGDAKNEVKKSR
jgi:uncharacterized protein YjbJ (UPF0337 family)